MIDVRGIRSAPAFALGALAGAMVVSLLVLVLGEGGAAERGPAPAGQSGRVESPRGPSATAQCRAVFTRQTPALRAAAASLAQWEVHIDAMNKLVAGTITLDQARAFWNKTRIGAQELLTGYDSAAVALANVDATCPSPPDSVASASCSRAVAARSRVVRVADTALATWRHHVHDMEMLRQGSLSAARAGRMWLRNWRVGARQVHRYHVAARAARGQHCRLR